jgi:dihydrofolate synthase/folylpolyglutamate synthase
MFHLPKFGDGIGLHRMLRFYAENRIDVDRLQARSIVVTGSNGKGSTARFIQAALGASGLRAGCFTSPHLFSVHERFLIGDAQIAADAFQRHSRTVFDFNARQADGDRIGAFEFLFLVAVLWFEEEAPDAIVWEAGIGGRYDPVRTLRTRLSVLTSIELEHTQILGATEELIAYDKIDALEPGGRLIVSPSVPASLYQRLSAYCALTHRSFEPVSQRFTAGAVRNTPHGSRFRLKDRAGEADVAIGLIGRHQADNAVTALAAAGAWLDRDADTTFRAQALGAFAALRWPGRLERVARDPDLWVDVGHTPHAIDVVTEAFLDLVPRERALVVFGVSAAKEVGQIARIAASRFDRFILTAAHKSGAPVETFRKAFSGDVVVAADTAEAARIAKARATAEGLSVLAIGGLFLAIEVQHAWSGGDPKELDFL